MDPDRTRTVAGDPGLMTQQVLALAAEGAPRPEFFRRLGELLRARARASRLELWVAEESRWLRLKVAATGPVELEVCERGDLATASVTEVCDGVGVEPVGWEHGVLWAAPRTAAGTEAVGVVRHTLVPIWVDRGTVGWLVLDTAGPDYVMRRETGWFGRIAGTLGTALEVHRVHAALRERVKELSGLYEIAQVAARPGLGRDELLAGVVRLLPSAWQYPEIAGATIEVDGESHRAGCDGDIVARQDARLVVAGRDRGRVEVGYVEPRPDLGEGPFLAEERRLIDAIAQQLAVILERREVAAERAGLQEQLLHADRLATLGMLAAGIGHELNEPLGAILGFAQLARKAAGLPASVATDLEKVEHAALHARDIVRKLVQFARKSPSRRVPVAVNRIVSEALDLLAARCRSRGVTVQCRLARDLPPVLVDPTQLRQVLVNLIVNGLDAMPEGGVLAVVSARAGDLVRLEVRDSGAGMSEDVARQVFLPFFTTKEGGDGTGLGLALAHDIVAEAGGSIRAESQPGEGTTLVVDLPAGVRAKAGDG